VGVPVVARRSARSQDLLPSFIGNPVFLQQSADLPVCLIGEQYPIRGHERRTSHDSEPYGGDIRRLANRPAFPASWLR
jgi:hypothetical protein